MRIRYTTGMSMSRRLDLHQHPAVYKTAALLFGHVGKQECKDLNLVGRLWRPLALPGAHSSRPPALRANENVNSPFSLVAAGVARNPQNES